MNLFHYLLLQVVTPHTNATAKQYMQRMHPTLSPTYSLLIYLKQLLLHLPNSHLTKIRRPLRHPWAQLFLPIFMYLQTQIIQKRLVTHPRRFHPKHPPPIPPLPTRHLPQSFHRKLLLHNYTIPRERLAQGAAWALVNLKVPRWGVGVEGWVLPVASLQTEVKFIEAGLVEWAPVWLCDVVFGYDCGGWDVAYGFCFFHLFCLVLVVLCFFRD